MMAMTPQEKRTLEDIERAFFESVESRFPPVSKPTMKPAKKIQDLNTTTRRSGWFSGVKERIVMKFVCCAPPQSLLDDDEIQEILAAMEEPPVKTSAPPRKDTLLRRSSASVMPMARASTAVREEAPIAPQPSTELATSTTASPVSLPRLRIKLSTIQLVVTSLLALQNRVQARQTERVALAIQLRWRRRQQFAIPAPAPAPTPVPAPESSPVSPVSSMASPVTCPEPDNEPDMADPEPTVAIASPKRPRHRIRKHRGRKKTKFGITDSATEETSHAVDSLTQLALTRKRLRSIDLESTTPAVVDVERDVHVLFGEEEIDDKDDDEELKLPPLSPFRLYAIQAMFPMQRCASVPPPPTACRPQPKKSKFLIEAQAASTLQCAWRAYKVRVEREVQRRLKQYEAEKHSVMPTIRSKMAEIRQRLEEMQERSHDSAPTIVDDDLDWL